MASKTINNLKKAQKQMMRLEDAQADAETAMWMAQLRIERLEAVLKRIAKTANYQKDWGVVVKCFSEDEFEIKEYIQLILTEE